MNTVIFCIENAIFKFAKKEVKEHLICKKTEYVPDETARLLEFILTDAGDTILNSDVHPYFGYVALDLIGSGRGVAICKLCAITYKAGQLKQFAIGYGNSPFDLKQKQKGGIRPFIKRKMPSLFGGKKFTCPKGHNLISMETWKT